MLIRFKMGSQHHAARIGIGGHGKGTGPTAIGGSIGGRPAHETESPIGYRRYRRGRGALFHQLAGGAGQRTAVGGDKFQRHFGSPHRDRVLIDQIHRRADGRGDAAQRLRAAVLRHQRMGTHICKIFRHRCFGEMHAIRQRIILFGPAGGCIPQHLGAVQKVPAVFLTHGKNSLIVGIHLRHVQVGVFSLGVQRRNGADDDIRIRPGGLDGPDPLGIYLDKLGGIGGGAAQIVGAKADDEAPRLEHGHCVRNGIHVVVAAELFAFQRGDGTRPHADHTNVVGLRGECGAGVIGVHHIARRIGVANEQRFIQIAAPRVLCGAQQRGVRLFLQFHLRGGYRHRRGRLLYGGLSGPGGLRRLKHRILPWCGNGNAAGQHDRTGSHRDADFRRAGQRCQPAPDCLQDGCMVHFVISSEYM